MHACMHTYIHTYIQLKSPKLSAGGFAMPPRAGAGGQRRSAWAAGVAAILAALSLACLQSGGAWVARPTPLADLAFRSESPGAALPGGIGLAAWALPEGAGLAAGLAGGLPDVQVLLAWDEMNLPTKLLTSFFMLTFLINIVALVTGKTIPELLGREDGKLF